MSASAAARAAARARVAVGVASSASTCASAYTAASVSASASASRLRLRSTTTTRAFLCTTPPPRTTTSVRSSHASTLLARAHATSSCTPRRTFAAVSDSLLLSLSMNVNNAATTHADMIDNLQRNNLITRDSVASAMRAVDRAHFCAHDTANPYEDKPQPIGQLATISSPYSHAIALETLADALVPGANVLDIGAGSGYLTVCFAHMVGATGHVTGVEHSFVLVQQAIANTQVAHGDLLESGRVRFACENGMYGLPARAPYDVIHVGAAMDQAPVQLIAQLKPHGRLLAPMISKGFGRVGEQELVLFTRTDAGAAGASPTNVQFTTAKVMSCVYAPMRSSPPAADVDDASAFESETQRLQAQVDEHTVKIKQWVEQFKLQHHNRKPTLADMNADEAFVPVLKAYSALVATVKRRKAALQQAPEVNVGGVGGKQ